DPRPRAPAAWPWRSASRSRGDASPPPGHARTDSGQPAELRCHAAWLRIPSALWRQDRTLRHRAPPVLERGRTRLSLLAATAKVAAPMTASAPLVRVRALHKSFGLPAMRFIPDWRASRRRVVRAVDGVDLDIHPGEC